MPHYVYSDILLTAVHICRAMWTPLLLALDIGGGRGNVCEREEVLTKLSARYVDEIQVPDSLQHMTN